MSLPTRQCPCEKSLSEKHIVTYDFGIGGIIRIYVCGLCLEKEPYSKCILKVGDKID